MAVPISLEKGRVVRRPDGTLVDMGPLDEWAAREAESIQHNIAELEEHLAMAGLIAHRTWQLWWCSFVSSQDRDAVAQAVFSHLDLEAVNGARRGPLRALLLDQGFTGVPEVELWYMV